MNRLLSSPPSIAVSALIRPSRILFSLICLYSFALLIAAAMVAFSRIGDLPNAARILVVCLTFLAATTALIWAIRQTKTVRLDISTNGQIRLVEHIGLSALPSSEEKAAGNQVVRLLPDSVLWSGLLLLRLHTEEHRTIVLPILRDSMTTEGFRTLSVACRWIAAQNKPADGRVV